jgi:hypothetical protein
MRQQVSMSSFQSGSANHGNKGITMDNDNEQIERCEDCGQAPDEGVCFYCKMD